MSQFLYCQNTRFGKQEIPDAQEYICYGRHHGMILRIRSHLRDLLGCRPVCTHPPTAAVSYCTESSLRFPCRVDFPLSLAEFWKRYSEDAN